MLSTSAGPNARAGFIAAPVSLPVAKMLTVITSPTTSPPSFGPRGSSAVPKTAIIRKNVAMASMPMPWTRLTPALSAGTPRLVASRMTSGKNSTSASAAATAPSNWAMM